MAPPKVGAPSRIVRKIISVARSLKEPIMEEKNPMQPEGVVDVDAIPSPIIEPMIPTLVEEKEIAPATEKNVD
jgi:hypothetical protein